MSFRVDAPYQPTGDQPRAIAQLVEGIERGYKHQTLLGATGTGKSVTHETPIFVVEQHGERRTQRVMPIGELIDRLMDTHAARLRTEHDSHILDSAAHGGVFYVQAFNPETCAVGLYPVSAFTRHATPPDMYRIETACGRSATLTGDHNLWVLRDGRLQLIETADARPTDYVPLPEVLMGGHTLAYLDTLADVPAQRTAVHAAGAIRSSLGQHGPQVFTATTRRGGIHADAALSAVRGAGDLRIGSSTLAGMLKRLCGTDARDNRLPEFWPELADESLALLLRAYFDGSGTVDRALAISATTASEQLASELCYALLRFGIWARVARRWKRATSAGHTGDWYYQVTISGQSDLRRFARSIGFSLAHKQAALAAHLGRDTNANVDLAPIEGADLRRLRHGLGLRAREVAQLAGISRSALQFIETNRRRPQRATLVAVLEALRAFALDIHPVDDWWRTWWSLRALCNLRWTPLASVTPVAHQGPYVYDITVPGAETFLAGHGGMFVHNTFVMAKLFERLERPALVLAHNKTLVSQLYAEFRELLPEAAVEMFISYYDMYTPEAYVPSKDLYIEKEADINEEIDRLRHAATQALFTRRDVLIVASVSAIYGLGSPHEYGQVAIPVRAGEVRNRDKLLRQLLDLQFERNDIDFHRGTFRVRGDVLDIFPANQETAIRVKFGWDEVERIEEFDPLTGELLLTRTAIDIYPAKHFIANAETLQLALRDIQDELVSRVQELEAAGKVLEAARLKQRTMYDLEMLGEMGYCSGIENYSRHMDRRAAGQTPWTLMDYFPDDFTLFVDESHITLPQVRGMFNGDRSRKETLVEYGFRLPSALDNRPLRFDEFERHIHQAIYVSATPGPYELQHSQQVVEQIIRPTGLLDPMVEVRPTRGQIDDLVGEIKARVAKGQRALVTTLTKRMAEDLADYLKEMGIRTSYLHSDIETLERVEILRDLRLGVYDVVVGINLLREGLDLPEVSLIGILDADKEGYLRSGSSLIQIIGRAARHIEGQVIMYADTITNSMRIAIDETNRRRAIQEAYNTEHGIVPQGISKAVRDLTDRVRKAAEEKAVYETGAPLGELPIPKDELVKLIKELEKQMKQAAKDLEFEKAAALRDQVLELRRTLALEEAPL